MFYRSLSGIYLTCFGENPKKYNGENKMAYTKPQVVAQNNASGSYAAGCPTNESWVDSTK